MCQMIKTGISNVQWNELEDEKFKPAKLCIGNEERHEVSWLDELLRGGLKLNEESINTLLIKGPPGSGKTSFILELCYRICSNHKLLKNGTNFNSLYLALDTEEKNIIDNAKNLGWIKSDDNINICKLSAIDRETVPRVAVVGTETLRSASTLDQIVDSAIMTFAKMCNVVLDKELRKKLKSKINENEIKEIINKMQNNNFPEIIVVDSLNILKEKNKDISFQNFLNIANFNKKTKLIIFVLDSKSIDNSIPYWEYVCDTIIKLDSKKIDDYFFRTIEIVKARFQEHVWGEHQMKIYAKPDLSKITNKDDIIRAHPFRNEGGIFIFPSIHYYLSKYKRYMPNIRPKYSETYTKEFNFFLSKEQDEKGLPQGRCTAFLGCRGGHKSHLGYLHILYRILKYSEAALVISLRDDEKMTENTMNRILEKQFPDDKNKSVEKLKQNGLLEVLYYPPGNISPDEFIHRMFISIHKLKDKVLDGNGNITVLFNSLDQLQARFPLCAKQDLFIPSIIQILTGENISSIFVAVDEKGQPVGQYGLIPMADLILSFHLNRIKNEAYQKIVNNKDSINDQTYKECVILKVDRFAGGQKAGSRALLELGQDGLCFYPINDDIDLEDILEKE